MLKLYSCLIVLNMLGCLSLNVPSNHWEVHKHLHCQFCIQDSNCLNITENKCEYYNKVDEILSKLNDDVVIQAANETEIKKMNTAVYDFVNEGLAVFENGGKCVPLISQYTDCHRDNICTGCYFCKCDASADWKCSVYQKCEQVPRTTTVSSHKLLSFMIDMFLKPDHDSLGNKKDQTNITTNDVLVQPFAASHQTIRRKRENIKSKHANAKYSHTRDLKLNALYPLTNIIHEKVAELLNLSNIRNYLSEYLQSVGITDVTNEIDLYESSEETFNNPKFVIYKFETNKDAKFKSRKTNVNILPKLLKRINDNIKQLASDIDSAKRIMNSKSKSKLPIDLKKIMIILTQYIKKLQPKVTRKSNNDLIEFIEKSKTNDTSSFQNITMNNKSYEFNNSSNFTRTDTTKILKRILENFNFISHSDQGENSTKNMFDILSQVGRTWSKLYYNINKSQFYNRLDIIKLFHLTLSNDMKKIGKMLETLTAVAPKMKSVDKIKYNVLIDKIDLGLSLMQKSIMKMSLGNKILNANESKQHYNISTKKVKDSLLHRIGSVLKNTKNDVVNILKSKFTQHLSKALTSKELATLNEKKFKNYESVMIDWQNKLDVGLRQRRSALGYQPKSRRLRLTHILPKYLQGKMNPIINNKKHNKNDTKKQLLKKQY